MAQLRLRHPKGVSTIQVDLESATVQDLLQEIYKITEILPSQQDVKTGYPPKSLMLIPELPISSLGLSKGEQLIVNHNGKGQSTRSTPPRSTTSTSGPGAMPQSNTRPPAPTQPTAGGPDSVETEGGYLVHRVVPDDNSCLFSSVAIVFEQNIGKAQEIRKIVADEIRKDMITWSEAILGRPRDDYISTILKPLTWGGAIELAILAKHYNTEISSVDVETGRIDRFTPSPEADSGNRSILIYSGIHYDAATLAPIKDAPEDFHQTIVPVRGSTPETDPILKAAKDLADKLRAKKAFTNTSTFTLKCEDCGKGLTGEKEARAHAAETGHVNFGEY
ncbi:OTU-domain-containing protein [Thelephora ganbajun]|uniref:OTU-domain-containing protein n=1 Tax=Thelephora ganbajun TaxID=370292 RepID=A0ACB6ZCT2_THEGA|nr:OTU-domain-containing protein [Thelephora ganbajun]